MSPAKVTVAIVGAGPAGLMAAETIARALAGSGASIDVFDAMPSAGRKFLLAGIGGLNLTHAEEQEKFVTRYGARQQVMARVLGTFNAAALRQWVHGLGIETFVGTSQRVFPADMKAAPLLRAWLHRLRVLGVRFHSRHRWLGVDSAGRSQFQTPQGLLEVAANATVLALGGASWQRLGSDGAWVEPLRQHGLAINPLVPSNCGFDRANGWSEFLRSRFAGQPIKPVVMHFHSSSGSEFVQQGECVLTDQGLEGSLVYAASAMLRDEIAMHGRATFTLDLHPGKSAAILRHQLQAGRGSRSLATHLKTRLGLSPLKVALLHELCPGVQQMDPATLATHIKALPLTVTLTRPLDEAISTAGGVCFEALDEMLMSEQLPGLFFAGEMLDWEAPTGGYLINGVMASGVVAGQGVVQWLGSTQARFLAKGD